MRNLNQWPTMVKLRWWQERALRRISSTNKKDFLVVATPGAGKTLLAIKLAHDLLSEGSIERLVIVCPTDHLRVQWAGAAARAGIEIDPRWSNADGVEAPDYFGVAVTYSQVSYAPDLFRMNCNRSTLVIFDEIHHAGDELTWGNVIRYAFEHAFLRVSLSGTPFRSDNNPIPFVIYEDGRSKADFEYGYADALADGVCRPIYFPCFEGSIEWLSRDGIIEKCSLLEQIERSKAAERLRGALDPGGEWLRTVVREADQKLSEIRAEGHTDAGGLIIAIDQQHANKIAELVRCVCGIEPVVAISEASDATERIRRFSGGQERWIIAVKMVSEGVDIPRLRVGVYATNVMSELFFRQGVGRFVRSLDELEEQSASLFLPAIEPLTNYARAIKEERDHQLAVEIERTNEVGEIESGDNGEGSENIFQPLSSDSKFHDVIFDGACFDKAEIAHATAVSRQMGIKLPAAQIAALIRLGATEAGVVVLHHPPDEATQAATALMKYDRKKTQRRIINRLANQLAHILKIEGRDIHAQWLNTGGKPQATATEDDLQRKRDWLLKRIQEVKQDGRPREI